MSYRFDQYRFDPDLGLEGPAGRIALRARDARLLQVLLEAGGRTVSKDLVLERVWEDRDVTEDSLFQATRRLRAALPSTCGNEIVQTLKRVGLRIGVRVDATSAASAAAPPAFAPSGNVEAVASLGSAWELAARRTPREIDAAIAAAHVAVLKDPGFVAAWFGLAVFNILRAARMTAAPREAGTAAVDAAERALAVDAECAPALAARGWVRAVIELDVEAGVADLDRSVRITPNYWLTRGLRGWGYMAAGRPREAVQELRTAVELNRWSNWYSGLLAQYLYFAGEQEAALVEARDGVQRFPEVEISHMQLAIVASGLDLHDEAIVAGRRAMQLAPDTPMVHTALACALARAGRRAEAAELIGAIESHSIAGQSPWLASAYLALGQRDRAIDLLERARAAGSPQFVYAFVDPRLTALHGDPAFERLRPCNRSPSRSGATFR